MSEKVIYSIPARFRRIENLHILFWLVKDARLCIRDRFWIFANCTWMIGEFYMADEGKAARGWAVVPFVIGLMILLTYYLLYFTQKAFRDKVVQQTEEVLQEELHFEEDRRTA